MSPILNDEKLNAFLYREGYVVLPMLSADEVKLLRDVYEKWHPTPPPEFYKSYFSPNEEYKREVEDLTMKLFVPKLDKYFINYIPYGGMLVVKPNGPQGDFPPHQDWSFVDEQKHWSLNMWCALEDVNEANGNMQMLRGSHRFMKTIRGSGTPDQYEAQRELMQDYMTDIPMKAGEAIFFFHGILHGSSPNRSGKERVSIGLSLIEKDVPVYYHFKHMDSGKTEEFLANVNFYINYVSYRDKLPDTVKSLGYTDFTFPTMTDEELVEKIGKAKKELDTALNEELQVVH